MTQKSQPAIWDEKKVEPLFSGELVCGGKYLIEEYIGAGRFGQVYRVRERLKGEVFAVKRLCLTPLLIERFWERSVKSLFTLGSHPNLLRFVDYANEHRIESGYEYYIVMEYAPNGTLADEIVRGYKSTADAIKRFFELLDVVEFIHKKGYIHRDLKPEKVLIGSDNRLKLGDFDTGKVLDDKSFASSIMGAELYMAPEVNKGRTTFLSDLYALGYILAEMASKRRLLDVRKEHGDADAIVNYLPDILKPIASKMIEFLPENRFQSCAEIRSALNEVLKKLEPTADIDKTRALFEEAVEVRDKPKPEVEAEKTRAVFEEAVEVKESVEVEKEGVAKKQELEAPLKGDDIVKDIVKKRSYLPWVFVLLFLDLVGIIYLLSSSRRLKVEREYLALEDYLALRDLVVNPRLALYKKEEAFERFKLAHPKSAYISEIDALLSEWRKPFDLELKWKFQTGADVSSSPALGDVDGDGKIEVVVGSDDNNLYVLSGTRPYGDILWPKLKGNNWGTGTLWDASSFAKAIPDGASTITNWRPKH